MLAITLLVQWQPHALMRTFKADGAALVIAALFLQLMSWTFVAQGLVYICSAMFQGFGNTLPSLLSSLLRFVVFAAPALWISTQPAFRMEQVWYLWMVSIVMQAVAGLWLLHRGIQQATAAATTQCVGDTRHGVRIFTGHQ